MCQWTDRLRNEIRCSGCWWMCLARFGSPTTACVDQAEDLSPQSSPFRDAWIGKDVRNKRVSDRVLFPSPAPLQLLFQPYMARRKGPCRASARLARRRGPSRNSDPATPGPIRQRRPQSAGAGFGTHQSGPGKARIQAQAPLPHDGRKPAPRPKSQPGALCDAPRLNARRARAQPPAARRRLQSPASILSPCCGQPQRQAGEFLESAPFESSLPKGMLTCP